MALDADMIALIDQRIKVNTQTTRAVGTCVARDSTGPRASVVFDGSTVAMPVKVLGHVFLLPGFRCVLNKYGTDWIVTGSFSAVGMGEASAQVLGPSGGIGPLTSSSFVDATGIDPITFTKRYDGTFVRMALAASCYVISGTPPMAVRFGYRFTPIEAPGYTATDYSINHIHLHDQLVHIYSYSALRQFLPAGIYSVQVRWRRVSGTSSAEIDANDAFAIELDEGVAESLSIL